MQPGDWQQAKERRRIRGGPGCNNDPQGHARIDDLTPGYEYQTGMKMSFVQKFFHPSGLPEGGQYINVYRTKGAVSLGNGTFYPLVRGRQPVLLGAPERVNDPPRFAACFNAIRSGSAVPADLRVGATAALTAIIGREATCNEKTMTWTDLGVQV